MFLKMAMVLEPMQLLMTQSKSQNEYNPRQALKATIFMETRRRESINQQQMASAAAASKLLTSITFYYIFRQYKCRSTSASSRRNTS
jgi:hypothetical protein